MITVDLGKTQEVKEGKENLNITNNYANDLLYTTKR